MEKIYLVKYYGGIDSYFYEKTVFATTSKSKADKYVAKFNKLLKKWKDYYSQFEENKVGFRCLKDEFINKGIYSRWQSLGNITKCYYYEIEFR